LIPLRSLFLLGATQMDGRNQLIEKLVTTLHLSIPERNKLGAGKVRLAEISAVVSRVLDKAGYFPPNARPWRKGLAVHDGVMIERLPTGKFRLIFQRSDPIAPTVLVEQKESCLEDITSVVGAYVSAEWPRGIDGILFDRS